MDEPEKSLQARPEQLVYASILEKGMLLGLVLVLISYVLYLTGLIKPYIPLEDIAGCWQMNVHE